MMSKRNTLDSKTQRDLKWKDRKKLKGWEKIMHANSNQKRAGVTLLILTKETLNWKDCKRQEGF